MKYRENGRGIFSVDTSPDQVKVRGINQVEIFLGHPYKLLVFYGEKEV